MKEYKNYIFDFDGTLMDTSDAILATIRGTINEMGLPPRTQGQCRSIIGIRTDEAASHLFPDVEVSNEEFAKIFRSLYPKMQLQFQAQPFPGVKEHLLSLHGAGHPMAIASSRRKASIEEFLEELGLDQCFCMIVGAEDVEHGKPNPEPVLRILDTMGWSSKDTLVVGDADVDILMGKAAGCDTCAVTYGNGSLQSLQASAPTYLVEEFKL